jgi:hypothetical protein
LVGKKSVEFGTTRCSFINNVVRQVKGIISKLSLLVK